MCLCQQVSFGFFFFLIFFFKPYFDAGWKLQGTIRGRGQRESAALKHTSISDSYKFLSPDVLQTSCALFVNHIL